MPLYGGVLNLIQKTKFCRKNTKNIRKKMGLNSKFNIAMRKLETIRDNAY